jgi:hypothetical protein
MAFSLFGKPFGYAAGGRVQAPRTTNVRGQHHKLAYINNEEEALLRARGGTGEKVHGGIPAFPPVRGRTQGRSNEGTGFSGGSSGGGSRNNNEPNRPPVGTGNGGSGGGSRNNNNEPNRPPVGTGNGGGGGGSSNNNNEPNRPPVGTGNGGSNNNSGGGGGADSGQAAAAEAARIERNRIAAKEAADRKEAQDQAIRDQIERDRAAQVESDRLQRNRDIVAQQQQQQQPTTSFDNWLEQAQNVRGFPPASTINNFNPYQVATTEENAFNSAVEQSVAADEKKAAIEAAGFTVQGTSVKNDQGVVVGSISDPINKFTGELSFAGAPTGIFEGNDEDYSMGTVQQPAAKTAVVSTAQSTLDKEREQAKLQGKEFFKGKDGRFYSTDPKADAALQAALFNRSVPYTKEANPNAFFADGTPRPGLFGYANQEDMEDGGGRFASGNTYAGGLPAVYSNLLGSRPRNITDAQWEQVQKERKLMSDAGMGSLSSRPDYSTYPETGYANAATTPYDGNDHRADNDQIRLNEPPVAGPPVGAPTCPEGYRFDSATNACVLGDASNTDPYQPIITPYTPPPLTQYTPFQPNAPFQPNFQTPSYLPQMPVQQSGIMASTPTQRYLGTA